MTVSSVLTEYPGPRPGEAALALLDSHEASAHDEVTGLLLRRAWTARANRALTSAAEHGDRPALLLVDLDGLKEWNDSLGHLAGDLVLAEVVGALRRGLRHVDLIGRFGGDEIAVVLADDHATAQAAAIGERLRERVEALRLRVPAALIAGAAADGADRHPVRVTVSIGAACARRGAAPGLRALLVAADTAVLAAKAAGRNTVCAVDVGPDGVGAPVGPTIADDSMSASDGPAGS